MSGMCGLNGWWREGGMGDGQRGGIILKVIKLIGMQGVTTVTKKPSRGLGCCELNISNKLLMNLFLIIAILFLVPFIVADLVLVWQEDILFEQWKLNDAYIKLGMLAIAIFLYALRQEAYDHQRLILSAFGISFQLYWIFEIGWLIRAAVYFWGGRTYFLGSYLWARFIIGFVLIIAGLVIYSFRSNERDYRLSDHELVAVQPTTERYLIRQ